MMDENKLLLAGLEDKYDRFIARSYLVTTDFFNLSQQAVVRGFLDGHKDVQAFLYGGYAEAERRQVVFVPDYLQVEDEEELIEYFRQNPEECPLAALDLTHGAAGGGAGRKTLTHRDYLGSLLGEGIRREKLGDIIVSERGAQVVTTAEMAEYLAAHYGKAGRVSLTAQVLPIGEIMPEISHRDIVTFTVSSPRLDTIVASVFHVSRKDAVSAISQGRVFVNEREVVKPDFSLKGGEKIVFRGKGKAIYQGAEGVSRKGKTYVSVEVYRG